MIVFYNYINYFDKLNMNRITLCFKDKDFERKFKANQHQLEFAIF